jgi:hypothetical protein
MTTRATRAAAIASPPALRRYESLRRMRSRLNTAISVMPTGSPASTQNADTCRY